MLAPRAAFGRPTSTESLRRGWAAALGAGLLLIAAPVSAAPLLHVSNVWSRPAVGTGVVYLTVADASAQPDRLIGAASPVARAVELHESVESRVPSGSMPGMPGMPGMSMESMRRVAAIPVPAHGRTVLQPGGYHVMLIGLRHALAAGTRFPLRLHFAYAGWLTVESTVRG